MVKMNNDNILFDAPANITQQYDQYLEESIKKMGIENNNTDRKLLKRWESYIKKYDILWFLEHKGYKRLEYNIVER